MLNWSVINRIVWSYNFVQTTDWCLIELHHKHLHFKLYMQIICIKNSYLKLESFINDNLFYLLEKLS